MATILLVDDEDLLREGVREILEMSDYTVIEASDGQEALRQFALADQVDLVITDIVMPTMDGVDFVTKLRETFPVVPILTISGGSRVVTARFGLDSALLSGANASLTKPFTSKQLLEKIKALLPA
jgi:CheY-like chemotaxis protein